MVLDRQCIAALDKAFEAAKRGNTSSGDEGDIFFVIRPKKATITLGPAAKANRFLEWIEYLQGRSKNGKVTCEINSKLDDAVLTFSPKL